MTKKYGFVADPALPTYQNVHKAILATPPEIYFSQPKNKAIFNLTTTATNTLPPGTHLLLALGLKFVIKAGWPANKIQASLERFENNVRTKYCMQGVSGSFDPRIYLKNPDWDPPQASDKVEAALSSFRARMITAAAAHYKYSRPNLSCLQNSALRELANHDKYIVIWADKNMGVVIMLRSEYIAQCLREHLGNSLVYKNITHRLQQEVAELNRKFVKFINDNDRVLGQQALTFFKRAMQIYGDNIARFRATAKVHKFPVKLRPVVAKVGTAIEAVSKWLDVQLQELMQHLPWCVKDSESFRREVIKLTIPPNARLVTFDAQAMYSNISIPHAIEIMKHWLELHLGHRQRPRSKAILEGLELVMRHNIMKFGDSYFLQKIGTAMGTSVAVVFANLYFGWHEKQNLLPKYRDTLKRIFHHSRFIDDVFFIWIGPMDATWDQLVKDYDNFGILRWDVSQQTSSVNFLDLTLTIENGTIWTKTYQKENNPYLYIPPHSSHAPGMIHGIIFSIVRTYLLQNTRTKDFWNYTKLLFQRHVNQGWDPVFLKSVFRKALKKLAKSNLSLNQVDDGPSQDTSDDPSSRILFHMKYHPMDIPRRDVRKIYMEECDSVFKDEIGIEQLTIAYSNAKTIGNVVAKAQLHQASGKEVSKYLTGEQA